MNKQVAFTTIRQLFAGPTDSEETRPIVLLARKPIVVTEIDVKYELYMDPIEAALGGADFIASVQYFPHGYEYGNGSASDVNSFDFDNEAESYERGEFILWDDVAHIPVYIDALEEEYHPMQHTLSRGFRVKVNQAMRDKDALVFMAETNQPIDAIELFPPIVAVFGRVKIVYYSSCVSPEGVVGAAAPTCGRGRRTKVRRSKAKDPGGMETTTSRPRSVSSCRALGKHSNGE